jgi:hypothetical protein
VIKPIVIVTSRIESRSSESAAPPSQARWMELAKRAAAVSVAKPLTKVEQQVGELPAAREVRPVATHCAIFVSPERARVAWAPSRTPGRMFELADTTFQAISLAFDQPRLTLPRCHPRRRC